MFGNTSTPTARSPSTLASGVFRYSVVKDSVTLRLISFALAPSALVGPKAWNEKRYRRQHRQKNPKPRTHVR